MKTFNHCTIVLLSFLLCSHVWAVSAVNPTGVNVRSTGPTTVFLTFQGTAGETAVDAFWCGDITVPANTPTATNPCVPGTLFGHLPQRNDLSTASGNRGFNNTTDIMTIPASVARRAYQAALRGESSQFFYVRQFVSETGATTFIAVTCRMAGGGARVPLALTSVEMSFQVDGEERAVHVVTKDEPAPQFSALIRYNGSGRLKGRWEIVRPGDLEPQFEDLLTEASLPVERRGSQRRYQLLQRFDIFLQPTGEVLLSGPDASLLPTATEGPYKILLRVEATADKEGNSNALAGTVISGGVAGFPMPVLRYYVSGDGSVPLLADGSDPAKLSLLLPANNFALHAGQSATFSWLPVESAEIYQLELRRDDEQIFSAMAKADVTQYALPSWVEVRSGELLRWRVTALAADGTVLANSEWRRILAN